MLTKLRAIGPEFGPNAKSTMSAIWSL
jgi:hypothetical protein